MASESVKPGELFLEIPQQLEAARTRIIAALGLARTADVVRQLDELAYNLAYGPSIAVAAQYAQFSHFSQAPANEPIGLRRVRAQGLARIAAGVAAAIAPCIHPLTVEHRYRAFVSSLDQNRQIRLLVKRYSLPSEVVGALGGEAFAPFGSIGQSINDHMERMRGAMVALSSRLESGLMAFAQIGASLVGGRLLGRQGARMASAAVRGIGADRSMGKVAAFIDSLRQSLCTLGAEMDAIGALVLERTRLVAYSLFGRLVSGLAVDLRHVLRKEVTAISLGPAVIETAYDPEASLEILEWVRTLHERIAHAEAEADWAQTVTLAEHGIRFFQEDPDRQKVEVNDRSDAQSMPRLLAARARGMFAACENLATSHGVSATCPIILTLFTGAPFPWTSEHGTKTYAESMVRAVTLASSCLSGEAQLAMLKATLLPLERALAGAERSPPHCRSPSLGDMAAVGSVLWKLEEGKAELDDLPRVRALLAPAERPASAYRRVASGLRQQAANLGIREPPLARELDRAAALKYAKGALKVTLVASLIAAVAAAGSFAFKALTLPEEATTVPSMVAPLPSAPEPSASAQPPLLPSAAKKTTGPKRPKATAPTTLPPPAAAPSTPLAPTQASSSASRTSCLRACIDSCKDDANCERGCASACPR